MSGEVAAHLIVIWAKVVVNVLVGCKTNSPPVETLRRPCWGPAQPAGHQRWHVYNCLGQKPSEWHFITRSRLPGDRCGRVKRQSVPWAASQTADCTIRPFIIIFIDSNENYDEQVAILAICAHFTMWGRVLPSRADSHLQCLTNIELLMMDKNEGLHWSLRLPY